MARPHRVDARPLRPAARPYLLLDGVEHALTRSRAQTSPLDPGRHLATSWRHRGVRTAPGTGSSHVRIGEGGEAVVVARNGPLDQQPLQPRLQA